MDELVELIKKNADLVVRELGPLSDVRFGFNRESVVWVEGFIERQRARPEHDPAAVDGLVDVLGSFLGECLIAAAGGEWRWSDGQQTWGVAFANDTHAFPFAKVHKQFANGIEGGDSIVGFYDVAVDYMATGGLTEDTRGPEQAPPG
ncbi:MAG TPA: hypothetical protein VN256_14135 [Pyrinomonadaceae bacterium]|nr:hypothetical protein [Pyrinomonadaceae bacterium]